MRCFHACTASTDLPRWGVLTNFIARMPTFVQFFSQEDKLLVFDGRTMRCLATLPTSKKVLLQLQYNQARDEIISGGSDGCFVWRLAAISCELSSLGKETLKEV